MSTILEDQLDNQQAPIMISDDRHLSMNYTQNIPKYCCMTLGYSYSCHIFATHWTLSTNLSGALRFLDILSSQTWLATPGETNQQHIDTGLVSLR
jgi:hypothetical protein